MSIFDSIIGLAEDKFGLGGGKANSLISAVLSLIIADGGLSGFLNRFRNAGLGDTIDSWILTGDNAPLSNAQIESALGTGTILNLAEHAGIDSAAATPALAAIVPHIIDRLTPDGEIPDDASLLTKAHGYLSGLGGAGAAAAGGALAANAFDRVGNTAAENFDQGKDLISGPAKIIDKTGAHTAGALSADGVESNEDENPVLRWLLPLLLLALLVILGFWFCGPSTTVTPVANTPVNKANTKTNTNANVNAAAKQVDSKFSIKAENGKYTVTGLVPDEATKKQIVDALTAQYGAENVNFDGLKIDANAKSFASGWWDNFAKLLPNLKDWKTGTLAFAGNTITEAAGLPAATLEQLKSLFTGWNLPLSVVGATGATKQANDESLKELGEATSIDEVIKALNVSIVNFDSAKSDIPADAKPILEKAAEVLKKQPAGTLIEIGGYTDNQGNAEANKKLSQSRADAIKKALTGLGVSEATLKAVGYGDARPIGDNATEEGRFKNRRIEYKQGDGSAPSTTTTTTNSNSAASNANKTVNTANRAVNAVNKAAH